MSQTIHISEQDYQNEKKNLFERVKNLTLSGYYSVPIVE